MSTNASFTSDIKLDWAQMACSWSHRSTFLMSAIAKNVSAYCFLASIQSLPICVKSASSTEQRQSTQLLSFAFLPRATCLFWYLSWCDVWCKSIVTKIVRARQYLLVDGVLRIRTFRFVRKIRRGFDEKYCWALFLIDTCRCFASSPKFVQFPLFCYEIKKDVWFRFISGETNQLCGCWLHKLWCGLTTVFQFSEDFWEQFYQFLLLQNDCVNDVPVMNRISTKLFADLQRIWTGVKQNFWSIIVCQLFCFSE